MYLNEHRKTRQSWKKKNKKQTVCALASSCLRLIIFILQEERVNPLSVSHVPDLHSGHQEGSRLHADTGVIYCVDVSISGAVGPDEFWENRKHHCVTQDISLLPLAGERLVSDFLES